MATSKQLPKETWQSYFDAFTKKYLRDRLPEDADISIISPEVGNQEQARNVRLQGVTYDPKDNVLEVLLENYDHLIRRR